jgi:hypothetical protein
MTMDFRGARRTMRWTAQDYSAAARAMGLNAPWHGCPIEAGFLGALVDHECAHGLMPGERTCCP